jgi:uncharacterized membrane protein
MKHSWLKLAWIIAFSLSLVCLIIGASFHGLRLDPSNEANYALGVNMGISMLSCFGFFLLVGFIFLFIDKKKHKSSKKNKFDRLD